jgi:IS4 transposase
MTQTRSVTTKALSAYLKQRHLSFSAVIHMLGLNQKLLDEEAVSDDTLGRVARYLGMLPEQLTQAAA